MRRTQKKGTGRQVFLLVLFLCYFLLLTPYIVHTNLNEVGGGVVEDLKTVPVPSLPADIQDLVFDFGGDESDCTVLLLENSVSGERTAVVTVQDCEIQKGAVVKVTDKIIEWFVDWHAYQSCSGFDFGEKFGVLVVGEVAEVSAAESGVEKVLSSRPLGSPLFTLSKASFLFAPLLLVVFLSLGTRNRFYLWNFAAVLALYSFEVFLLNTAGSVLHEVALAGARAGVGAGVGAGGGGGVGAAEGWKYFGYLFVLLVPFTVLFARYEESEEGQRRLKKFYAGLLELVDRLFQ